MNTYVYWFEDIYGWERGASSKEITDRLEREMEIGRTAMCVELWENTNPQSLFDAFAYALEVR